MLVNDEHAALSGELVLALEKSGQGALVSRRAPFSIAPLGQQTLLLRLPIPDTTGDCLLTAAAQLPGGEPTVSRRKVEITRE